LYLHVVVLYLYLHVVELYLYLHVVGLDLYLHDIGLYNTHLLVFVLCLVVLVIV